MRKEKPVDIYNEDECQAYKDAKANNSAYIIEDGWIVRVFADGHREKIKKLNIEIWTTKKHTKPS